MSTTVVGHRVVPRGASKEPDEDRGSEDRDPRRGEGEEVECGRSQRTVNGTDCIYCRHDLITSHAVNEPSSAPLPGLEYHSFPRAQALHDRIEPWLAFGERACLPHHSACDGRDGGRSH